MDKEQLAKQYADKEVSSPDRNSAIYYTTLDRWNDAKLDFLAGYESMEQYASQQVIKGKIEVLEEVLQPEPYMTYSSIINKISQLKTQLENEQD